MPATYDIDGHPLLSTAATALSPEELDAYTLGAEHQLGLRRTTFTGDDLDDAKTAIVRQVNRTLVWEKQQGVTAIRKAGQAQSFSEAGAPVDRVALAIADRLNGRGRSATSASTITTPRF